MDEKPWFKGTVQRKLTANREVFHSHWMCSGEPAISPHSYTVLLVQWSTRLLPIMRDPCSIPRGVLMWSRDSPVSIVSLHWWPRCDWSLWPCLRRASDQTVTRPSCRQCNNSNWSHTGLLSWFHACCRSPFWLHNRHCRLLGGALWRACNLTAFIHSSTGTVVHPFASHHKGTRFNPQGVLTWNGDSPVSLSRYTIVIIFFKIYMLALSRYSLIFYF
jgi:hypothetical protein